MLTKLTVKNLGCFNGTGQTLDFSKETLLCGPNNSGKSMFLSGINLLRAGLFGGSLVNELCNLVNFKEAIHNHDTQNQIEISMVISLRGKDYLCETAIKNFNYQIFVDGNPRIPDEIKSYLTNQILYLKPNRPPLAYSSQVQPSRGVFQPLNPDGSNVINYLLERFTDQDPMWNIAQDWLKKIDPNMSQIKTPISGNNVSFVTNFGTIPVNVSLQGSGIQSASAIIAALIFSPEESTIIIEEPEVFLHPESQEIILDLINYVVAEKNKQVIFSTHSTNILLDLFADISDNGVRRGETHMKADPTKFSMWVFSNSMGNVQISRYPIQNKLYPQFRTDFKKMWG